ncbi:hypothetical protein SLS62_010031 [Diatrype stigma]|uniref:Increased loss of mitochondrial DNA protein 1 n=1 Tax=Diatrype stigma TaxID=117547 RepID=A0AAN9YHA0_9PEZI
MAIFSAKTLIGGLALLHISLAFFFITNPSVIEGQSLVYVIGEAMGMPQAGNAFSTPSPASALTGVVLLVLGLTDLTTLSTPPEAWLLSHWPAQAPLRVFLFALLAIGVFATAPATAAPRSDPASRLSHPRTPWVGATYGTAAGGAEALRNRVLFTFAFVEFVAWYWLWTVVRDEAGALVAQKLEKAERERLDRLD